MTIKKYNKLVRDKIPQIIFSQGFRAKVYIANEIEYTAHLKEKLQEEVSEFIDNPCVDELADIQEVILTLAALNGWEELLEEKRVAKNINRGGFSKRYILVEVNDGKQEKSN
jgi:predicted house-cleaning noncanonical NTP pyrophosphatase (MazG superfamily)